MRKPIKEMDKQEKLFEFDFSNKENFWTENAEKYCPADRDTIERLGDKVAVNRICFDSYGALYIQFSHAKVTWNYLVVILNLLKEYQERFPDEIGTMVINEELCLRVWWN